MRLGKNAFVHTSGQFRWRKQTSAGLAGRWISAGIKKAAPLRNAASVAADLQCAR